ncbi:AAA family ATPase [Paracoccus sp. (in: a-proteobacteria)]|uniref:AAA family ATPase n=1 Tax=Paracoccus sp. TaxID=267 RepID=UPI0026DF5578|nr:AAA family ATPase [Paracoccus sp. (in: a-proteobacteria)]MDO5648839.1 AAA family ATPase [Paracoccus sp. (in: a-proteobacteria)]
MTDQTPLFNNVAPLRNVMALSGLIDRIQTRGLGLPGMAVFYGPSGYGKTTAAVWNANKTRAYQVQLKSAWRGKKLCQSILLDLGIAPARTVADMIDQISEEIARSRRPLIIDEADHLINAGMIELVRDIYESSGAAIVLIGEERLPQKLQKYERVHGRMLDWVAAQPADLREVGHLAQIYCRGIELDADMQRLLLQKSNASVRRICVNLDRVREFALTTGKTTISGADWGDRDFYTGLAPAARRDLV